MVVALSPPNGMVHPTMANIAQVMEVITTLIHDHKFRRLVRHPFADDKSKEA